MLTSLSLGGFAGAWCGHVSGADRHSPEHVDAGLPASTAPLVAYNSDASHPLNRLHQLLFISDVTPSEVSGALPRELAAGTDSGKPWYFRRRTGALEDTKTFGGDVRISPVVAWESQSSETLATVYEALKDGKAIRSLTPLHRQLLQWDILSVWWRLEQKAIAPPADLWKMADLIRISAQSADELKALPTGWDLAQSQFSQADELSGDASADRPPKDYFSPDDIFDSQGDWSEISRRSTQLFVATQSLRSSRVFLKTNRQSDLQSWMEWHRNSQSKESSQPASRIETAMVLALVGITPELTPVATPLIDEIRFRTVYSSDEKTDPAKTTTQDGSSIWVYFIDRQQTLQNNAPTYRSVPMTSQSIFLEYGTEKHATYAAQCSLCHRLTNAGNQTIAGIRSLAINAEAGIENDPTYRHKLAEAQMQSVVKRLAERIDTPNQPLPPIKLKYSEIVHSIRN